MGLFDFVFGKAPKLSIRPLQPQQMTDQVEIVHSDGGDFIRILSKNFYGACTHSMNRRYTIAWCDAHSYDDGIIVGYRTSGYGRYILLDGGQVIAEGKIARPNDGKVANNGTFIFNDWCLGNESTSVFLVFNVTGHKLITKKFKGNLYNNGVAFDGRFAACQLCSVDSKYDSALVIFDLYKNDEINSWVPESGWADYYDFSTDGIVRLGYLNLGAFRYSMAGEFLDQDIWQDAQLSKGNCDGTLAMIEYLLKEENGKPSVELALKLTNAADRTLSMLTNADTRKQARALKLRGLCLDAQGILKDALDCYDKALLLDSKIGVKRRAEQIRKNLI